MSDGRPSAELARLRSVIGGLTKNGGSAADLAAAREALADYHVREDMRQGLEAMRAWATTGANRLPKLGTEAQVLAITTASLLLARLEDGPGAAGSERSHVR